MLGIAGYIVFSIGFTTFMAISLNQQGIQKTLQTNPIMAAKNIVILC